MRRAPRLVFCFGPGGAGKTSVSAALSAALGSQGHRVCCLTIDPAKRLAGALGLGLPLPVDPVEAHVPVNGKPVPLWVVVLGVHEMFIRLIKELVPSRFEEISQNPIFQVVVREIQGLEHYLAIDVLDRLKRQGAYDVVVVDTPPTRHAVSFLQAPDRMLALFSNRFFTFFVRQYGALSKTPITVLWDAYKFGTKMLERVFGISFLNELARFFGFFEDVLGQIRNKVEDVVEWIHGPKTSALLVGYEYMQKSEMAYYLGHIREAGIRHGGLIYNQSMLHLKDQLPRVGPESRQRWVEAIQMRLAVQNDSMQEYRRWASSKRLAFGALPWILEKQAPLEFIGHVAEHILQEDQWLERIVGRKR